MSSRFSVKDRLSQHLFPVDGLGQAFHGEHLIADLPVGPEVDVGVLAAGGLDLLQLDLLQGAFSGSGLPGLGSVGAEPGNEFLQLLDLFFLLLVGFLHLADQKLAGLVPEIIVSGEQLDLAVVDVSDLGADLIQEIPVVGHHDHGVVKVDKELLQPGDGVQVQVVGGLVQKQDVRIAKEGLSQQHLYLLRAFQVLHHLVVKLRPDAKAVEKRSGVGLRLPAVHGGEFRLQLACLDPVLIGEILLGVEGLLLLHDLIESGIAHHYRIQHRVSVILEMILLEEGKPFPRRDGNLALGGLQLAGKDLEERGLSRAVGPDKAVAVPLRKFNIHIFKQRFFSNSQRHITCTDHNLKDSFLSL